MVNNQNYYFSQYVILKSNIFVVYVKYSYWSAHIYQLEDLLAYDWETFSSFGGFVALSQLEGFIPGLVS